MQAPTLDETKLHLRVDGDAEDALIANLIDAAQAAVLDYLDRPSLPNSPAVHAACLLLVGDLYANREAQVERQLHGNTLYDRLLAPYRNYW